MGWGIQMNNLLLPESKTVNVSSFNNLFDNMSESYKIFWFRSIFDAILSGKREVSYDELVNHMIIDAWDIVLKDKLSLGHSDNLEKLIIYLCNSTILEPDSSPEFIENVVVGLEDNEYKRIKRILINNVPYRLLAPFVPDIKGKDWDVSIKRLIDKINEHKGLIYYFKDYKSLNTYIELQTNWCDYILQNQNDIKDWIDCSLYEYLRERNSGVNEIKYQSSFSGEEDKSINNTVNESSHKISKLEKEKLSRKSVSLETKLYRRIRKEFDKKKLLGDIKINDDEYGILIKYLKTKYKAICISSSHTINDPVFAVALIQIGIRCYDGRYWPYVKKLLDNLNFTASHQKWLGDSFQETLKKHKKIYVGENDYVDSILMHAFVSDKYAHEFFDYLYAFYKIDMDRDITRLDRQTMNELASVIEKNDNTGRTYYIKEHTADAVRLNLRGCKNRIRRYLNLIDKAFWGEPISCNANNRLMNHFIEWKDNSLDFINEKSLHGGKGRAGKKSFSSPYIHFDPSGDFSLILPSQLIRFQDVDNIYWQIEAEGYEKRIDINPYQEGVLGFKTEKESVILDKNTLFCRFDIKIKNNENTLRSFKISKELIRFFDLDGDYIRNDSLVEGNVFSYSLSAFKPESEAIIDSYDDGVFLRTNYDLVYGDIIRFPDNKPLSVGGKMKEGPQNRGIIDGIISDEDKHIPVYKEVPYIFMRMNPNKIHGTAIVINGKKYRLYDNGRFMSGISSFPLFDRTSELGFILNLKEMGLIHDGEYSVSIDVPNDRISRSWEFVLIYDFSYEFEDAPYIFMNRGTLSIPDSFDFKSSIHNQEVSNNKRRFNFDINPGEKYVFLSYMNLNIGFEVPYFAYKFSGEEWNNMPHVEVWYTNFNPKVSFIFNSDKIKIYLDDNGEDNSDQHFEEFYKSKQMGLFQCDLNRFKSWFGRDSLWRQMYIDLPGVEKPISFLKIYTKSVFNSGMLKADFINNNLIGDFDLFGNSKYCVDIEYENNIVLEKQTLINYRFEVPFNLKTGIYKVSVYEIEEDEFGFGDSIYYQIGSFSTELLNPKDLSGMCIEVTKIHLVDDDTSFLTLAKHYQVVNLEKTERDNIYRGKMIVGKKFLIATFPVFVHFFDLDHLQNTYITYVDDYDEGTEFLYDEYLRFIVKHEDRSLSKSKAYRRYKISLFPEDYVFDIKFIEPPEHYNDDMDDSNYNNLITKDKSSVYYNKSIFK